MKRSIQRLTKLLPAPDAPVETSGDWNAVEKELGTKLPQDYQDFISTYGTGRICDWLMVFSPFAQRRALNLITYGGELMEYYRGANLDPRDFPFKVFPEDEGLIPWGITDNGDEFYWRTKGKADCWDVVVHDRGRIEYSLVAGTPFGDFLLASLRGDEKLPLARAFKVFTKDGITFEPFLIG